MAPSEVTYNVVFEKEVISRSNNNRIQPFIMHLKAHKVMQQGCLSFILSIFGLFVGSLCHLRGEGCHYLKAVDTIGNYSK